MAKAIYWQVLYIFNLKTMDFAKKYDRDEFLRFLRNNLLWEKFKERVGQTSIIKKFNSKFFTKITKLWEVEEFENLIILEIEHKSKNDARISLTKDIFKLLRQFEIEWLIRQNALVFLEKKWKVETIEQLIERFDVEVVRKEFFNHYLNLYIRLYKAILDDVEFVELLKWQWVKIVGFSKNLIWKIVFIYFIQKKGWLWVKKWWKYWKDWDKNFMRSIWNDFKNNEESLTKEKKWYFYNDYLEWLFFAWLNKDKDKKKHKKKKKWIRYNDFNMKIPYLNGWLFKKDYKWWKKNIAKISNDIFSN